MSEYVGLRKVAGGFKLCLELIEEGKINVDLLVSRAIERPCFGSGSAAPGLNTLAKQNEFGVLIARTQNLSPGLLRIIENERDELDHRLFGPVARFIDPRGSGAASTLHQQG